MRPPQIDQQPRRRDRQDCEHQAIDAIEQASTAALGEFIKEELAEGNQEIQAIITLLESAAKSSVAAIAAGKG